TALAVTVYCGAKALTENYDQHYGTSHSRSFDKFANNFVYGRPQYLTSIPTVVHNETTTTFDDNTPKPEAVFPENPDDLLPELERDENGNIYVSDNLRIRPEKHEFEEGDKYNPRHHEQHYHVESRIKPKTENGKEGSWKPKNRYIYKPEGYYNGMGTGFLPGETFPGSWIH
ncbi:MAG: hypothetical protein KDK62_07495, partial [Chlamydiia bacterium]|nr:hypothetical protein [Chlamydiia bacterium]